MTNELKDCKLSNKINIDSRRGFFENSINSWKSAIEYAIMKNTRIMHIPLI